MPIRIACQKCKTVYNLPDSVRGKTAKVGCTKCGASFVVQVPPAAAQTPRKSATPQRREPQPAPRKSGCSCVLVALGILFLLGGLGVGGAAVGLYVFKDQLFGGLVAQVPATAPGKPTSKVPDDKKPPVPGPGENETKELEEWQAKLGKVSDAFLVVYFDASKVHLTNNSTATYTYKRPGQKQGIALIAPPPADGMMLLEQKVQQIKITSPAKFKEFEVSAAEGRNCDAAQALRLWKESVAKLESPLTPPVNKFYADATVLKESGPDQFVIKFKDQEVTVARGSDTKSFDPTGKPVPTQTVMQPGNLVSVKVEKRQGSDVEILVEAHLVKEGKPEPGSTVELTKDDDRRFWGTWHTPGLLQDNLKETWHFLRQGDAWTVEVDYHDKDNNLVGQGVGKDAKLTKDQLGFTLTYTQAPPNGKMDGREVTVDFLKKDLGMQCRCRLDNNLRSWRIQRKPADPQDLVGTWEGLAREGGLAETWTIRNDNNRWSVEGRWLKNGSEVGTFHGEQVAIFGKGMKFNTKPDKLPYEGFDGEHVWYGGIEVDGDVLWYGYATGPGAVRHYPQGLSAMTRVGGGRPRPTPMPNPPIMVKTSYDNAVVLKQVAPGQYLVKVKDQDVKVQLDVDTEAYDMAGKKVINGFVVMVPGYVVNLKAEKRPKQEYETILEVRMVKQAAAEPMPNPPKDAVASKGAVYMGQLLQKGGGRKTTFRARDGSFLQAELGNGSKAFDQDGKEVPFPTVLRIGSVYDLMVQPGDTSNSVAELRLVKKSDGPAGGMQEMTHEGAVLVKVLGENVFLFKIGGEEVIIDATNTTKTFDTTLKEMPLAKAMTEGAVLDLKTRKMPAQEFILEATLRKGENASTGAWTEVVALKSANLNYANYGVTFSPDGKQIALTMGDAFNPEMTIIDVATKKAAKSWKVPMVVQPVVWSGDGSALAGVILGNSDRKSQVVVWDAKTWEERASFEVPGFPGALALSGDGGVVATASDAVKVWDVGTKKELLTQELKGGTRRLALSADGKRLVYNPAGTANVPVAVIDVPTGKQRLTFPSAGAHLALSEDGNTVVEMIYGTDGLLITVWDVRGAAAKSVKVIKGGRWKYDTFTLIDKGRHLVLGGGIEKDELRVYNLATGELTHSHAPSKATGPGRGSLIVGTIPDSSLLLTLGTDNTVRLWTTPFAPKP